MSFALGCIFVVALFFAGVVGAYLGLQMAVDYTKRNGHFMAYGKRWRAVRIEDEPNPDITM